MPGLDEALRSLTQYRKQFEALFQGPGFGEAAGGTKLAETEVFGPNPGNLRMLSFVPTKLPRSAPLVVVLHGCGQSAADYDRGAGWSALADKFGFALLFPEQKRANNPNLCFNWFQPEDVTRDAGEVASIRAMVERMVVQHGLDSRRVSITGLSAGGAMTAAMLACYPEIFSHGAIIAGLPFGVASNVQEALRAMFEGVSKPAKTWASLAREASPHAGAWPAISIWHGSADTTVKPINAVESTKQWLALHGLAEAPSSDDTRGDVRHRVWRSETGAALVEVYDIAGMGHGTPIAGGYGKAGPYMLDVGLSSTEILARDWGLLPVAEVKVTPAVAAVPKQARPEPVIPVAIPEPVPAPIIQLPPQKPLPPKKEPWSLSKIDPGAIINKALRAAGLMK